MIIRFCFIVYVLLLFSSCTQNEIYRSETFTITKDAVRQGDFFAQAISPEKLISDYESDYRIPTKREVYFKFSLNGADNERFPGEDHRLILDTDNDTLITDVFLFGAGDPYSDPVKEVFLNKEIFVTFRCDINHVLESIEKKGSFITVTGQRLDHFEGLYIAGSVLPLSWDFSALTPGSPFQMYDHNDDGIYELTLRFSPYQVELVDKQKTRTWVLSKNISGFPQYTNDIPLLNVLYQLSLEELLLNIREDSTFMAGKKWPGVWTRDISYSILLSLAALMPEVSKNSLLAKVKNGRIIQDTGTGGSWPVSTDRMTWALAAWEIYVVSGEKIWLEKAYQIIRKSAEEDLQTAYDEKTGLFYGESSFLDWREQSYPLWMDGKDIYHSQCLGTNAVHFQTYRILSQMARELGEDGSRYDAIAGRIKSGINEYLWSNDYGYYGQYLYGRNFKMLSERSETLGGALTILFDIADSTRSQRILASTPVTEFGPPCISPQIPDIPAYHNNGIWPFVAAYWTWAAAKGGHHQAVEHGLASIYRQAALFGTNKENFVALTGDYKGTEINSDRQLWSVAGHLAGIYRVFLGMSFQEDGLHLTPFIPDHYGGFHNIHNFRYRNMTLDIRILGSGNKISKITHNGILVEDAFIPADLEGEQQIVIHMQNNDYTDKKLNVTPVSFSPSTPLVKYNDGYLYWQSGENASAYEVFRNGQKIYETSNTVFPIEPDTTLQEMQVRTRSVDDIYSFLSEPVPVINPDGIDISEIENNIDGYRSFYAGYTGYGYIESTQNKNVRIAFEIYNPHAGSYALQFRYANGEGPINTNNKCAIRSLYHTGQRINAVIFPQRGNQDWENWGYSSLTRINMDSGHNYFELVFEENNRNMNGETNSVNIDHVRIIRIK